MEAALTAVVGAIQLDQDLEGAILAVQLIVHQIINLQPIYSDSYHYVSVIENVREMVDQLKYLKRKS